jgi:hypothetical protein
MTKFSIGSAMLDPAWFPFAIGFAIPNPTWLPFAVWTDYRLAVLLTVLIPLGLLLWATFKGNEVLQRSLIIYWRVASLLAITVYLFIGALPIGFISGWAARILIPLSLWFWIDLNEEIREQRDTSLKLSFTSWRWAVSIYCVLGAIATTLFLPCAFKPANILVQDAACRIWLAPPWQFYQFFHSVRFRPYFLGFLGLAALGVYVLYFAWFLVVRLGKQGRSATGQ